MRTWIKLATVLVAILLFLLAAKGQISAQFFVENPSQTSAPPSQKIVVEFMQTPDTLSLLSVSQALPDGTFTGGFVNSNVAVYSFSGDIQEAIASVSEDPNVVAAYAMPRVRIVRDANDTYFDQQWAIQNMIVGNKDTQTKTAWDKFTDVNTQTAKVKVAMIDTGADAAHPDLAGKIKPEDAVTVTCPNNGSCQFKPGSQDDHGHGTHVAGIIGAATNNTVGVAGVGWGVQLMPVKVLDKNGEGDLDVALKGIEWAVDHGAKIINMSFGVIEDNVSDEAIALMQTTINKVWDKGVVVVAAAGNCGAKPDPAKPNNECAKVNDKNKVTGYAENPLVYPAALENVLSVGALTRENTIAPYSEYGDWVSIAAPGGYCCKTIDQKTGNCTPPQEDCILSAYLQAKTPAGKKPYSYQMGTSMASPQAAGVAALVWAANANLKNTDIVSILQKTANKSWGGSSTIYGGINALEAVSNASQPQPSPTPTEPITPTPTIGPTSGPLTVTPYPTTGAPRLPKVPPSPFPTGPYCSVMTIRKSECDAKLTGDANCDGVVDEKDYNLWNEEFDTMPPPVPVNQNANFSCVEGNKDTYFVDLSDYEIWRRHTGNFPVSPTPSGPTPTPTSALTSTPTPSPTPTSALVYYGTGKYEDTNTKKILFTGSWKQIRNARASKQTFTESKTADDKAIFNFKGKTMILGYVANKDRGIAQLWIDGSKVKDLDQYDTEEKVKRVVINVATNGKHTFELRVTGNKSQSSTDTLANLDYISIIKSKNSNIPFAEEE